MSVDAFRAAVKVHVPNKNDQTWFPRWLARYAEGTETTGGLLPAACCLSPVIWSWRSQRTQATDVLNHVWCRTAP